MSHFLRQSEVHGVCYPYPHAAVKVEVTKYRPRTLTVIPDLPSIVRTDTQLVRLPDDVVVLSPEGTPIQATWGFYVTAESIDPFHLLLDIDPAKLR